MLATNVTQAWTLPNNKFALCLRSLPRLSLALCPCEFVTCMRALICSPVPAGIGQSDSQLGQPAPPIHGLTTCAFCRFPHDNIPHLAVRGYLMLLNPRVVEYSESDDVLFLFPLHIVCITCLHLSLTILYNCSCCKRVDCLVHVTSESESKDQVSNSQMSQHSQMSLNSSKTGQEDPCSCALMQGQPAHWPAQYRFYGGPGNAKDSLADL